MLSNMNIKTWYKSYVHLFILRFTLIWIKCWCTRYIERSCSGNIVLQSMTKVTSIDIGYKKLVQHVQTYNQINRYKLYMIIKRYNLCFSMFIFYELLKLNLLLPVVNPYKRCPASEFSHNLSCPPCILYPLTATVKGMLYYSKLGFAFFLLTNVIITLEEFGCYY